MRRTDLIWHGVPTRATRFNPFFIIGSNSSIEEKVWYWSPKLFMP